MTAHGLSPRPCGPRMVWPNGYETTSTARTRLDHGGRDNPRRGPGEYHPVRAYRLPGLGMATGQLWKYFHWFSERTVVLPSRLPSVSRKSLRERPSRPIEP